MPSGGEGANAVLLRIQDISKSFGGAQALANVSFDIQAGEVHALCGENGAGKSTLIKVLSGSVTPDSGQVLIGDQPLQLGSVAASEEAGVAVIHQELVAFPHLDARDNIFVGREPRKLMGLMLDRPAMLRQTRALLKGLGEHINPYTPVGELPMAQRQMVGIARALSKKCRLLIMDEPTASLSARETEVLFRIIRQLKSDGISILYVSHRMEEIFQLSDRVTVFRDGKWVATKTAQETTDREIIRLMVGRQLLESSAKSQIPSASVKPLLEVKNLTSSGVFEKISFAIKPGEVVSMSGLVGAGRSEVARAIFGVDPYDGGEVLVDGKPLPAGRIKVSMRRGLALVPEDRQHLGLVLPMPVGVNLSMAVLPAVTRFGMVSAKLENPLVADLMQKLQVKAASPKLAVSSLSGGNQQKVLLGKWLATKPRILILDEPTRGVDVGAKAEIYKLIQNLASEGLAVLVISSDLPEVLLLSDRILVMRTGKISGELSRAEASQEKILSLAVPQVLEADLPASDDSQSPAAKSNDSDPNSNGSGPNPKSPNSRAGVA